MHHRMMLNTSQNLDSWQTFFNTPSGSKLGLMNAIYQIGSLASFPFVYVKQSIRVHSLRRFTHTFQTVPSWPIAGAVSSLLSSDVC